MRTVEASDYSIFCPMPVGQPHGSVQPDQAALSLDHLLAGFHEVDHPHSSHYCLYQSFVFTALHGMQTRSYDEISVRPYVCLSDKRVHCDKTEERYV